VRYTVSANRGSHLAQQRLVGGQEPMMMPQKYSIINEIQITFFQLQSHLNAFVVRCNNVFLRF
jgi:hypothetical protein